MHWPDPTTRGGIATTSSSVRGLLMFQAAHGARMPSRRRRPDLCSPVRMLSAAHGRWLNPRCVRRHERGMGVHTCLQDPARSTVGPMLDMPPLDTLITPGGFTRRVRAGSPGNRKASATRCAEREDALRGRRRQELGQPTSATRRGAWRSVQEFRAASCATSCSAASRGHIPYWMNVGGGYSTIPTSSSGG